MSSRQAVRHPSHNHPLRGHNCEEKDEIICSGCDLDLIGAAFKCTKSSDCDYFLHKSCFDLPRETNHKSHQAHVLTLLYSPTPKSMYTCDACGEHGSSFTYNCSICDYDVHVGCVSMPETVKREDHAHPLTLFYGSPYNQPGVVFKCDVCEETVPNHLWAYYCMECDYGTHLHSCEKEEEEEKGDSCEKEEEEEKGDSCEKEEEEEEEEKGGSTLFHLAKSHARRKAGYIKALRHRERGVKTFFNSKKKGGSTSSANSELPATLEAQREMEKMQSEKEEEEANKEEKEGSTSSANSELAAMLEAQREMELMQFKMHLAMQNASFMKNCGASLSSI